MLRDVSFVTIISPRHGELSVEVVWDGTVGRPWRARLNPAPPQLLHLLAAYGKSDNDAVAQLRYWVEHFDDPELVSMPEA